MLILLVLCALVSTVSCALLLRWGRRHARHYALDVPQRFHAGQVPRVGGAAMLLACAAGWAWMAFAASQGLVANAIPMSLATMIAWMGVALVAAGAGLAEDLTHRLSPRLRLGATLLAGIAAAWLLDLRIPRLEIPWIDTLLAHPAAAITLAVLAVAGLPHAFNLIDGYNGLASSVAIICCLTLGYVAMQVGDRQLAGLAVALAGATAGFLMATVANDDSDIAAFLLSWRRNKATHLNAFSLPEQLAHRV